MSLVLRVFDVEHGACAMFTKTEGYCPLAMVDCGHNCSTGWRPSNYIRNTLGRSQLDYLLITNADQDHISDLSTLVQDGINVSTLMTNTFLPPETLRQIKLQNGPLTSDMETLLHMRSNFGPPGSGVPVGQAMGGIQVDSFSHPFPTFIDTNNLSCAFFISYGPFKILFPGDLEKDGWRKHLQNPFFVSHLRTTTVLVASHHGRENGFCPEVFQNLQPHAVVISDKSIVHDTQEMTPDYRSIARPDGIRIANEQNPRQVLTTRNDGDIVFNIELDGNYMVHVRA